MTLESPLLNAGADWACSILSPYTGVDIHRSGLALALVFPLTTLELIGLGVLLSLHRSSLGLGVFSLTIRADLAWSDFSPYSGVD